MGLFCQCYKGNNFFAPLRKFMSGIAGIVGEIDDIEYRLAAMLRSQSHRGGNNKGFWVSSFVDSQLGLAHCGKTVSETEEDVRQPYVDETTWLVVAMEGEVYNYRELRNELSAHYTFVTDSSVEVISKAYHRWGKDFLLRLNGAFVVVIYDRDNDVLLLARDRFGVKPLYYATQRGCLFFASEVRSLFAAGVYRSVSPERWAGYMLYSSYGAPYSTFWEGVHQLPAGFWLQYNGYSLHERSWYNLQEDIAELVADYDERQMRELFIERLERSADSSMADVSSCGLRVAGRVESQALHIVASNGQHGWKIHTFTGEVGNITGRPLATPVWVTAAHAVGELEKMNTWVEEPFDGTETVVRTAMFRRAGRDGVRVVCSGVGLDVLWQDCWDATELSYNYISHHALFSPSFVALADRPDYLHHFTAESDNMRYLDLYYERIPHILRFFDRSAAESGVSVRLPFIDSRLIALSFALPMISRKSRRELFDGCMQQRYNRTLERRNASSMLPLWLGGGMKEWVGDALSDLRCSTAREWFEVSELDRMWTQFCDGTPLDVALLWKCISLHRQLCV